MSDYEKEAALNWSNKLRMLLTLIIFCTISFLVGCSSEPQAILGMVSYDGSKTGNVVVIAQQFKGTKLSHTFRIGMQGPGHYDIHVWNSGTYTVSAYIDINKDSKQSADEPYGFYDVNGDGVPDKIEIKGEVSGINFTIHDP